MPEQKPVTNDECQMAFHDAEKEVNALLVKACRPFYDQQGRLCNGFNSEDVTAVFDKLKQSAWQQRPQVDIEAIVADHSEHSLDMVDDKE